jgi:hypothetical protein
MPDPIPFDPAVAAEQSKILTPQDATWIEQQASRAAVSPALLTGDVSALRNEYDRIGKTTDFQTLFNTTAGQVWLAAEGHRAALVQDDLKNLIETRQLLQKLQLPDPAGMWDQAGSTLKQSAKSAGLGLTALGSLVSLPFEATFHYAQGDEDVFGQTSLAKLSDVSLASLDQSQEEAADISYRSSATGGSRFGLVLGSIMGQAPEMLVSGFGITSFAKSAVTRTMMSVARRELVSRGAALTTGELKAAIAGSSFLQAGQEGARNLVSRMKDNADAGKELIGWRDVAASAAVAAVIMATEMIGGASGEMALLNGFKGSARPWIHGVREVSTQSGQEAIQEVAQNIANDLADGGHINWTEAGWAALGGAIGGGLFSAPSVISGFRGHHTPAEIVAIEQKMKAAQVLANTPQVSQNAESLISGATTLAQSKSRERMTMGEFRKLVKETSGSTTAQHFDLADFQKIADKKGVTAKRLAQEWGADIENGTVTLPTHHLMIELSRESDADKASIVEMVRVSPEKPNLTEIGERIGEIQKLFTEKVEAKLPDGVTKDDSADLETDLVAEITAASKDSTKRTAKNATADAAITAALVRTAAIAMNDANAKSGNAARVTPRELWNQTKVRIVSGEVTGLEQPGTNEPQAGWTNVDTTAPESLSQEDAFKKSFVPMTEANKQFIDLLSKAFGVEIVMHDNYESYASQYKGRNKPYGVAGFYSIDQGRVHIAARKNIRKTAMHEVGHAVLRTMSKEKQSVVMGSVWKAATQKGKDDIGKAWRTSDPEIIIDEMLAEATATLLYERPDFILNTIATPETRSVFVEWYQKMADKIADIVSRIRGMPSSTKRRNELLDIAESMMKDRAKMVEAMSPQKPMEYTKEETDAFWKELLSDASPTVLQQPGDTGARAGYDYEKRIIAIGKSSDASSVQHELMHHWLEMQRQWAQQMPDSEFAQNMKEIGSWAGKNAEKVAAHYNKTKRSGKDVDTEAVKAATVDMSKLDLSSAEGKAIHEAVTGAYEEYLATGKAPTKGLRYVFSQMAGWFRGVYGKLVGARNASGVPLLSDDIRIVFDRMLRARDDVESGSIKNMTAEQMGLSPEQFSLLEALREDVITEAQGAAVKRLEARAKLEAKVDRERLIAAEKENLAVLPVYQARTLLDTQKMSEESVARLALGSGLEQFTAKNGVDPQVIADKSGYTGDTAVVNMLADLSTSQPIEVEAARRVDTMIATDPGMSLEQRTKEILESKQGRLQLAAAEARVLRDLIRVAKQGKKEENTAVDAALEMGIDDGDQRVQAAIDRGQQRVEYWASLSKQQEAEKWKKIVADLKHKVKEGEVQARWDEAALKKAHAEETTELNAEWRLKARAVAEQAKMKKEEWDVARQKMLEVMRSSGWKFDGAAAHRMQTDPMTAQQIANAIPAQSAKVAKMASKGDWNGALNAYMEVEILSSMADIAARTERQAAVSAIKEDFASRKAQTLAALRTNVADDMMVYGEIARQQVAKLPATQIREGNYSRRAEAARRRREKAILERNPEAILQATAEIAMNEAMEIEVMMSIGELHGAAAKMKDLLRPSSRILMAAAGLPTLEHNENGITTREQFASYEDLRKQYMVNGGTYRGYVETTGRDLTNIRDGMVALMSTQDRDRGAQAMRDLVSQKQEGYHNLTTAFRSMIETGHTDPDKWTILDWQYAVEQMATVDELSKNRATTLELAQRDASEASAVTKDRKPPKQREAMNAGVALVKEFVIDAGHNLRTMLQSLGPVGKRWMDMLIESETMRTDHVDATRKIMDKAVNAYTSAERSDLDKPIVIEGVQTSRMENLIRMLKWGTDTGRQRVLADLEARGLNADQSANFTSAMMQGMTAKDVNLLNSIWEANERLWPFLEAAARKNHLPASPKLPPVPFSVMVDGKKVSLAGGYSSITYEGDTYDQDFLDEKNNVVISKLNKDWTNVRMSEVRGKKLRLRLDDEYQSQMSKIRTASFMSVAFHFQHIWNNATFRASMERTMGNDWYEDVRKQIRFVLNSQDHTVFDKTFGAMRRAATFGVYSFNLLTAPKQLLGVVNSMAHPDIGVRATVSSMLRVIVSPRNTSRLHTVNDSLMRQRSHYQNLDYVSGEESIGRSRAWDSWLRACTYPMRICQYYSDLVTYDAAYQKSLQKAQADGKDATTAEYESILTARKVLHETQGTAMKSEAVPLTNTEMARLITFGGKWMMNYGNHIRRQFNESFGKDMANDPALLWKARKEFTKTIAVGLVLGAAMQTAANAILRPEKDDEEERDLQDYALQVGLDAVSTPNWVTRIVAPVLFNATMSGAGLMKDPQRDPALLGIVETGKNNASMMFRQFGYMLNDEKDADFTKFIGSLVGTGAIILPGIPAVQMNRAIKAANEDNDYGYELFVAALFGWDTTPRRGGE